MILGFAKRCSKCDVMKPLSEFYREATVKSGRRSSCKSCKKDTRKAADRHLARRYKMTRDDFDALLAEQGGGCAICGATEPKGRTGRFHVDHDHGCCGGQHTCGQCVRALLCSRCNLLIGQAEDDPQILQAAADYLTLNRRLVTPGG